MSIWKLAPIPASASDNAWAFTRWHGQVLVRARNPKQARQFVADALRIAQVGETDTDQTLLPSPWLNEGMVACFSVPVSTYSPEGPDQILRPHSTEYRSA